MKTVEVQAPAQHPESTTVATWKSEPALGEVLAMTALTGLIFVAFLCLFQNYFAKVYEFGDSLSYMTIASAIRRWDFRGLIIEHFWGLPYAMALFSMVTRVSDLASLLIISAASSLAATALAYRLWGGWVAALFAVLNFDWMQRSFLGGSEPLFVALLFGSFLAMRRNYWLVATVLAALATTCRPLGVLALIGIGVTLLWKREFRKCALATAIGTAVGAAYALPLRIYFGSGFANVHGYDPSGKLFGIPFYAIIKGTILYPAPWTNLILTFGWIFFVSAGLLMMAANEKYRAYARQFPVESIFAVLYPISIYCYNYPYWARGSFPRFIIPALPFVLLALMRWIPKDRRLLWGLAVIMAVLAAASAIGIQNVAATLRRAL